MLQRNVPHHQMDIFITENVSGNCCLKSKCIKTSLKSGALIYQVEMINFCLRIGEGYLIFYTTSFERLSEQLGRRSVGETAKVEMLCLGKTAAACLLFLGSGPASIKLFRETLLTQDVRR